MHCGFQLPPNHTGPCPKCGQVGTSADVYAQFNMSAAATAQVETAVNASGTQIFSSHNLAVPTWWSQEGVTTITKAIGPVFQNEVRAALEQHDKDIEKKEKSTRNRLSKIAGNLLWIVVGILLGTLFAWMATLFH